MIFDRKYNKLTHLFGNGIKVKTYNDIVAVRKKHTSVVQNKLFQSSQWYVYYLICLLFNTILKQSNCQF